jgi:hypothetical protein
VTVAVFDVGEKVDVVGTSKGKGFQGGVKRYHFRGGPRRTVSLTASALLVRVALAQRQAVFIKVRVVRVIWAMTGSHRRA